MAHCENCGSRIGIHGCEWCNEELYILDQYQELDMQFPHEDSEFMKRANEQQMRIAKGIDKTLKDFQQDVLYNKKNIL